MLIKYHQSLCRLKLSSSSKDIGQHRRTMYISKSLLALQRIVHLSVLTPVYCTKISDIINHFDIQPECRSFFVLIVIKCLSRLNCLFHSRNMAKSAYLLDFNLYFAHGSTLTQIATCICGGSSYQILQKVFYLVSKATMCHLKSQLL